MPATKSPAKLSTVTFLKPPADFADPDSAEGLELVCAANHPAEPVDWLWPNRIAVGKVTLIAGDPGLGKSVLALDVAARVTRGGAFPEEAGSTEQGAGNSPTLDSPLPAPGSVLILSASDDLTDTIRPRLDAMGADPSRVFVLPSITDLRHDFGQLKAAVDRVPNCRLIVVDPVNAFVGPSDSHFHTVVRRVLVPLTRLAKEKGIAILAITQLRKADGPAVHRAAGSMGLVTAAQSLWTVCRDPRDESRNLFLPLKHNLTATARGLAFRIVTEANSGAPQIAWEPEVAPLSPDEAFAKPPKPREPSPERQAAREWLLNILAAGPRPARLILDEGEACGFLNRTLQRAFHELRGHTAKRGLVAGWWWSLARETAAEEAEATPKTPDIFEGVTFDEDVANQAQLEALHGELQFGPMRAPTVAESIAALDRARPRPSSETGHPMLDQMLRAFRASRPTKAQSQAAAPDSRSKLSPNVAPLADQVQCARKRRAACNAPNHRPASRPSKTREPVA
ncbi:MAG: AAA family ATPase [Pirellulales bacterium]